MEKHRFDYFASCPMGSEEMLQEEIKGFGVKTAQIARGGVSFESYHEIALKTLLFSRLASRIFKRLYTFHARHEKDMYQELTQIKWKSLLTIEQTFRINTVYGALYRDRAGFNNSHFTTLKAKDAIVDWFWHNEKARPNVLKDGADFSFLIRVDATDTDEFKVCLLQDLTGNSLHQRGYRAEFTEAPVKENLAAALIKKLNWNPFEENFYDGMMGSGTFVIEAALIAADIPPTYLQVEKPSWSFLKSQWFLKDELLQKSYQDLLMEIKTKTETGLKYLKDKKDLVSGSDIDLRSVNATIANLKAAKLSDIISVYHKDALTLTAPSRKTLYIFNPPYGERLQTGEFDKLQTLYRAMGDHWKNNLKSNRVGLFTGDRELLKCVGLKSTKKFIFFNGPIEARLATFDLY